MASKKVASLDPGLRGCGLAIFYNGELVSAEYVKNTEQSARGPEAWAAMAEAVTSSTGQVDVYVTERMRINRGCNTADILEVQGVVGAASAAVDADKRVGYLPSDWGGQVPKDIKNSRVMGKLSKDEVARIKATPKSLLHNVIDAIGIGLYYLGRYK